MFGGLDGENQGSVDEGGADAEEIDGLRSGAGLDHQGGKVVDAADNFWKLAQSGLKFLQAGMEGGRGFEIQIR
ncbi:MAG: hypothetical protein ACRD3L_13100 [Terriglobales bacterium]